MSQFLHQIFYADNKFDITTTDNLYADLNVWAVPKPLYARTAECENTEACSELRKGAGAKNEQRRTSYSQNATTEACSGLRKDAEAKNEQRRTSYPRNATIGACSRLSIFQSIFVLHYGYAEYSMLGNRIANREIEEKQKIMETLSKTPKKLKDGSQKLTNDNIQEIISGLFVSAKEEVMQLVAYSVYYNKIIYLVFTHSYLVFSPTKDTEITDTRIRDREVYILYQTRKHPKYGGSYYPELEPTPEIIQQIHNTKVHLEHYAKPFRGISAYKIPELEMLARKIGVLAEASADPSKPVKHTKRELYDKIVEVCCQGICA
jgi:hypothetical protein